MERPVVDIAVIVVQPVGDVRVGLKGQGNAVEIRGLIGRAVDGAQGRIGVLALFDFHHPKQLIPLLRLHHAPEFLTGLGVVAPDRHAVAVPLNQDGALHLAPLPLVLQAVGVIGVKLDGQQLHVVLRIHADREILPIAAEQLPVVFVKLRQCLPGAHYLVVQLVAGQGDHVVRDGDIGDIRVVAVPAAQRLASPVFGLEYRI